MEYTQLVTALKKPGADILATLDPQKVDAWHMIVGIAGEALELLANYNEISVENIIEELGDMIFYTYGLAEALGLEGKWFDEDYDDTSDFEFTSDYIVDVAVAAGKVVDLVKKWVVYNKPLDVEEVRAAVNDMLDQMQCVASAVGVSMKLIQCYNKAKLTDRYGEKYSDGAAVARADKGGAE